MFVIGARVVVRVVGAHLLEREPLWQQVLQHQNVRLLQGLSGRASFDVQQRLNGFRPFRVAHQCLIRVGQGEVACKLLDEAGLLIHRQVHPRDHVVPVRKPALAQIQRTGQLGEPGRMVLAEPGERSKRGLNMPLCHVVGEEVVVDAIVVLVGADHVAVVVVPVLFQNGCAGPEAGAIQDHLGAVIDHECVIAGDLPVLHDAVRDVRGDVDLDVTGPDADSLSRIREVCHPRRGDFLASAGALPWELGAFISVVTSLLPRARQVVPPIQQHVACQVRQHVAEERQHEDLGVPEDVVPVAEPAEGLGADAGTVGEARRRDDQLVDVEPQRELGLEVPLHEDVRQVPGLLPCGCAGRQPAPVPLGLTAARRGESRSQGVAGIEAGYDGNELLDGQRIARAEDGVALDGGLAIGITQALFPGDSAGYVDRCCNGQAGSGAARANQHAHRVRRRLLVDDLPMNESGVVDVCVQAGADP